MSISASPGLSSAGVCQARYRRGSCTRSVMVFFFTPSRTTVGAVSGGTGLPAGTSPNHFSTSFRVAAMSMSPAITRLALPGT